MTKICKNPSCKKEFALDGTRRAYCCKKCYARENINRMLRVQKEANKLLKKPVIKAKEYGQNEYSDWCDYSQ